MNKEKELLTRTSYSYDGLGQMTEAYDLNKNPVKTTYDLLGNKTSLYTRDTGLTEYFYNNKGQLYRKIDPNLRNSGDAIDYDFDEFGRMYLIDYPWMKDTEYVYGKPGAPDNGAGRLLELSYEAGSTSYQYGLLGEITSMTRTIERQGPSGGSKEATIMYQSDYLGRMEKITYPDSIDPKDCETVTYGYDSGGQVTSITGEHKDLITKYVEEVGYDEYGQRTYIRLGNKTETHYNYDSERRWLENIKTTNSSGENLQNITYEINKVGNIDYYINDSEDYLTKQTYTYDDLYQLTNVAGQHLSRPNGSVTYRSEMTQHYDFDNLGRMTGKSSQIQNTPRVDQGKGLNYSLDYQYYPDKPHQPERIGNLYYRFDANGNMIEEREGGHSESTSQSDFEVTEEDGIYDVPYAFGLYRKEAKENNVYQRIYTWDEENRLKETLEDDLKVEYKYDPSGQRTIKYSEKSENLYFDSLWSLTNDINNFRQSKHIYLGQTRIATKLGLENNQSTGYEEVNTYYFHTDHVNSAQYITDYKGKRYEHYEYTPHGEIWIEKQAESFDKIPFRWTGKELDEETGNYYIGARYANPKTSIWLSGDPALENYFPYSFTSEDAKQNSKLPNGGFYNHLNLSPYNFNNNNPVKFMDADGKCPFFVITGIIGAAAGAVVGGVKSYVENGKVDWGQVAVGAAIGGAIGLTGGAAISYLSGAGATASAGGIVSALSADGDPTNEIRDTTNAINKLANNYVYLSKASNGVVQYVGITNNLARRAAEHLATKGINIEPLLSGLTRSDARAVEQTLIEIHGLIKNGGTLINMINSIASSNPTYAEQLKRGLELLKLAGYN